MLVYCLSVVVVVQSKIQHKETIAEGGEREGMISGKDVSHSLAIPVQFLWTKVLMENMGFSWDLTEESMCGMTNSLWECDSRNRQKQQSG